MGTHAIGNSTSAPSANAATASVTKNRAVPPFPGVEACPLAGGGTRLASDSRGISPTTSSGTTFGPGGGLFSKSGRFMTSSNYHKKAGRPVRATGGLIS